MLDFTPHIFWRSLPPPPPFLHCKTTMSFDIKYNGKCWFVFIIRNITLFIVYKEHLVIAEDLNVGVVLYFFKNWLYVRFCGTDCVIIDLEATKVKSTVVLEYQMCSEFGWLSVFRFQMVKQIVFKLGTFYFYKENFLG